MVTGDKATGRQMRRVLSEFRRKGLEGGGETGLTS
jgi:hypothetical protein